MTIFGLNSPEIFVILLITLVILGTKRIEKGLDLLSRLLKFLLSNQSTFDIIDKKKEFIKEKERTQKKGEEITRLEDKTDSKKVEPSEELKETKKKGKEITRLEDKTDSKKVEPSEELKETKKKDEEIMRLEDKTDSKKVEPSEELKETKAKEDISEKRIKIANVDNKDKKPIKTKDLKRIEKDKTVKKVKTKKIVKDKNVINSKRIIMKDKQIEK